MESEKEGERERVGRRKREREKVLGKRRKANNHTQIIQAITLQLKLPKLQLPKGATAHRTRHIFHIAHRTWHMVHRTWTILPPMG